MTYETKHETTDVIWTVENGKISQTTKGEFMPMRGDYASDGVAAVENSDGEAGFKPYWQPHMGSPHYGAWCETEVEAWSELFHWNFDERTKAEDLPPWFNTEDQAREHLAQSDDDADDAAGDFTDMDD